MNIVKLRDAIEVKGEPGIVIEAVTVTPECAAQWLKCNHNNRPVRKRHVSFLASEILSDNWLLNGQAIVISDNEQVLDGQHRLLAIIEAGKPVKTLVVYGISPDAFKTIDTGAPRTGIDALALHHPDHPASVVRAVGSAVPWCYRMEAQFHGKRARISNTDILAYVEEHPSLWHCAETLTSYPSDARPISVAAGTASYEIFNRKNEELAADFMRKFFTGELLEKDNPEFVLRALLIKDAQRITSYPMDVRMRMTVKAWNCRRRGMDHVTRHMVVINPNDPERLVVL